MAALTTPDEISDLITHALEQQDVVCILYSHDGKGSARVIVPSSRFISADGVDCLRAYDSIHSSVRTFQMARIRQAHPVDADAIFP